MLVEKLLHSLPPFINYDSTRFDLEIHIERMPCLCVGYYIADSTYSRFLNDQLTDDAAEMFREEWTNPFTGIVCGYLFEVEAIENDSDMVAALDELRMRLMEHNLLTVDRTI